MNNRIRSILILLSVCALGVLDDGRALAGVPPAPVLIAPAGGASVQVPFAISWSAVSDPTGILGYNWQVSSSSSFTSVVLQNSTNGQLQDTVSGLPNGAYFWRVQAVSGDFMQGPWSQPQSFTVAGAGAGEPAAPTLAPTQAYSTFHPFETITFNWTAVAGAATYVLQAATDPSFPIATRIQFDNIPNNTMTFAIGNPEGNYFARVYAVNAGGIAGVPSNVINFSVFFNNPIGPPPVLSSPANGASLTLPVTLTWAHVPNPQPSGYELQIAKDSGFRTIEEDDPQLNGPSRTVLSLTAGTKFWRVRSAQGDNSPTTAAETAFSTPRTFTVIQAPPQPATVTLANSQLFSGDSTIVSVQLTSASPAGGATISLTSSNPAAAPVPATVQMPGNTAFTQFTLPQTAQVTAPTPVTITASLNSGSASVQFTLMPPSLKSFTISPSIITGGAQPGAIVTLNGQAPAGGAPVSLTSNSPAAVPPSLATVPPGSSSVSLGIPTGAVTANTPVTLTANWNGVSAQSQVTLTPQQPPASLTLNPASTVGGSPGGSFATVTLASPASTGDTLQVTISNPSVATQAPATVTIPAGSTTAGFSISTAPVSTQTVVTISVTGGGVTRSANLTVNPASAPSPALSAVTLSPSTTVGGNGSQGTATLASAAPLGGTVVTLASGNPSVASVPASVPVAAGAISATFPITTSPVATSNPVTITASAGSVTRTATLTVTPPSPTASLTVTATGRSGNAVTSSPAGISVAVGNTGSAPFPAGTPITLTVSNGRTAVWSGACSSGGNKNKSCTFTMAGSAAVTANVQ